MASEEMLFENVDGRMDACLYYKLTYEPSAQVSLKHIHTQEIPLTLQMSCLLMTEHSIMHRL